MARSNAAVINWLFTTALFAAANAAQAQDEAPCLLKVYAGTTLELHSGLEELYGLVREAGSGYATFTCINPTNLQSHELTEATLAVKQAGKVESPALKSWLDVNRYYLVTSFNYESGVPVSLEFVAKETIDGQPVSFTREYLFFDR